MLGQLVRGGITIL